MLRVTAYTNILISAVIYEGNEYRLVKLAKLGKIKLVLSLEILKEFRDVISRPKFGFSMEQTDNVIEQIINLCEIVFPKIKFFAIKEDPDDNIILECAFAGKADYIVSGDKHLLELKKFKNIPIIKTSQFLELLK